ncbi:MAG: protein kinase [Phycisphaerae bacterium]|nr:protein kinase [Phycisphaerae bacterium]
MASDAPDRDPERATDEDRESLFDAFLDAISEGRDEPAMAFLARHGVRDTSLAGRLEAIRGARGTFPAGQDPWLGKTLGGFRIESLLGEGGMGLVYRAVDVALERLVAIKLLRPEVAGASTAQARFEREARSVARLRHRNIVSLLSIGSADGVRYLAMELIEGRPLDEIVREARESGRPLAPQRVVRWARDIADALQCAHDSDIVHRDVKASNVLIAAEDDRAMLVDFGIARARDGASGSDRPITISESIVGSPYAMAPERIGAKQEGALPDDPVSDVYGVGILLWECLAGRPPFDAASIERMFVAILHEDPPRLRSVAANISRDLETVTMKAMEKSPLRRYPSAAALRDDLDALLTFRPIAARPDGALRSLVRKTRRHRALLSVAAVAVLVAAVLLIAQRVSIDRERRVSADETLREAASHVTSLKAAVDAALAVESRRAALAPSRFERHLSAEEDRELEGLEHEVALRRLERDAHVDRALELLAAAERLGSDPARLLRVRQGLYIAQYEDARRREDVAAAATLRRLIREHDPDGTVIAALERGTHFDIVVDPPNASLYLFRLVDARDLDPDAEPRLVPAPYRTPMELPAGTWALEALSAGPRIREHDCIVALDGVRIADVALVAPSDGQAWLSHTTTVERVTDSGTEVVTLEEADRAVRCKETTRPMPRIASARLEATSIQPSVGDYVLVADAPGYQTTRLAVRSVRNQRGPLRIMLPAAGDAPPGFLPLPTRWPIDTWIMEREVTVTEYLAFVNDPKTLEAIRASNESILVPRSGVEGVHCIRGADGLYRIPPDWQAQWPALGISWDDAVAYATWRTEQAAAAGEPWTFALPRFDDWMAACAVATGSEFITGSQWRPKWASSVFSHERPTPSPVLAFPRDESVLGVRDLIGNVSEYVDDWWREDVGHRKHAGGSWAYGDLLSFRVYFANGRPTNSPSDTVGLRLVARRRSQAPPP